MDTHFSVTQRSDRDLQYMTIRRAMRLLGWTIDELGKEMCTCADFRPRGGRNDQMVVPTWAVWRRMAILAIDEIKRRLRVYQAKRGWETEWLPYRTVARRCRVKWQLVYRLCAQGKIDTKTNDKLKRKRHRIRGVDLKKILSEVKLRGGDTAYLYKRAYDLAPAHVKQALPKP